ncbi:hypothetical protein [Stakelama marina]|uniref:Uncharacterized protein n=1 Tax=Stakelama marina TaxID=2826939 RepID=A0A8T4IAK7_9SPHN|nr:hypothetical protein [Stakelama marina]MBR0552058.1 hypothetical protein [Stakelama marina]
MSQNLFVKYEVVLRDGGGGYWLTVDPQHPSFPDEFLVSRNDLDRRAVEVLGTLRNSTCRDESTAANTNTEPTALYFASRQPWANNDYVEPTEEREPSFFDAHLLTDRR